MNWKLDYSRYQALLATLLAKREDIRAYLGIFLSLFTVSFFSIFALRPTLITIGELNAQIKQERETLATLNQKVENLETASLNLQKVKADLTLLSQAIPTEPNPHLAIRQIEGLAAKEGVTMRDAAIGKTPLVGDTKTGLQLYPFSFTFQGDAEKILNLLKNIGKLRRNILVETLVANTKVQTGTGDLAGSSTLQLTIEGKFTYYPELP